MGCRAGRADPEIASRPGELSGGKGAVEVGPIPLTYPQTQPVGSRTPGAHVLTCAHSTHRQADRTCMCSPSVQAPLSLRRPQEQRCQSCLEAEAQRSQNVRRREATPGELDLDWGCWLHLTCAVTRCGFRQPTPAPGSAHCTDPGVYPSCSQATRSLSAMAGSTTWCLARVLEAEGGRCSLAMHPPTLAGKGALRGEALSAHLVASEGTCWALVQLPRPAGRKPLVMDEA